MFMISRLWLMRSCMLFHLFSMCFWCVWCSGWFSQLWEFSFLGVNFINALMRKENGWSRRWVWFMTVLKSSLPRCVTSPRLKLFHQTNLPFISFVGIFFFKDVQNKTQCLEKNYTWINSKISFDNVGIGYLALFQVVGRMSQGTSPTLIWNFQSQSHCNLKNYLTF